MIVPDALDDIEYKVKSIKYNPANTRITVFNDIGELAHLGIATGNPYSDMQQIQIGLYIIKNTNDFENGLIDLF